MSSWVWVHERWRVLFTRVAVLIQHAARPHCVVGRVVSDVSKGPDVVSLRVKQLKKSRVTSEDMNRRRYGCDRLKYGRFGVVPHLSCVIFSTEHYCVANSRWMGWAGQIVRSRGGGGDDLFTSGLVHVSRE